MAILTNKTLEHFLEWKVNNKNLSSIEVLDFKHLSIISQNALIIEFFDEQNIYIDIRIEFNDSFVLKTFDSYVDSDYVGNYSSRLESTIQAITKANDIYNVRYSKQKQAK